LSLHHGSLPSREHEKWRARIASASPYFPWTPWLSPQGNGREQHDLRLVSLVAGNVSVPAQSEFGLQFSPPFPNPGRTVTSLRFVLAARSRVSLGIYDIGGREVATLVEGMIEAGSHTYAWDGRLATGARASDGVYFARLVTPAGSLAQKVVRMH
jgi:flagellar hook assembly protein FlgD